MHAVPPMPTFTLWTGLLGGEVILKALAQGMPDLVPACSGGDVCSVMGLGINPRTGEPWLEATNEAVGFGAHAGGDGEDGIMHLTEPGCRNNPIEVLEVKAPMLIEHYGLPPRHRRTGQAPRRRRRVPRLPLPRPDVGDLDPATRRSARRGGCEAGRQAKPNRIVINPGTDAEQIKGGGLNQLAAGEVLVNDTGGGGGWGNPFERDPSAVAADVRNGFVSVAAARADYGVVIDEDTFDVDQAATAEVRRT